MSKSYKRRDIVVEGRAWRWLVTRSQVFAWEPLPSTRGHSALRRGPGDEGFERARFARDCEDGRIEVGPGQIAAWIREDILGLPPAPPKLAAEGRSAPARPRKPVAAPASQREAYLVSLVRWFVGDDGSYERSEIVAVHLDPAVAFAQAAEITGENARRSALRDGLREGADRVWQRHRWSSRAADYDRDMAAAEAFFFRQAGLSGGEAEEWVRSCPDGLPTARVTPAPLFSSVMA